MHGLTMTPVFKPGDLVHRDVCDAPLSTFPDAEDINDPGPYLVTAASPLEIIPGHVNTTTWKITILLNDGRSVTVLQHSLSKMPSTKTLVDVLDEQNADLHKHDV